MPPSRSSSSTPLYMSSALSRGNHVAHEKRRFDALFVPNVMSDITNADTMRSSEWRLCSVNLATCTDWSGFATADRSDLIDPPSSCGRSEEHTSELQSRGHLVCR